MILVSLVVPGFVKGIFSCKHILTFNWNPLKNTSVYDAKVCGFTTGLSFSHTFLLYGQTLSLPLFLSLLNLRNEVCGALVQWGKDSL